MKIEFETGATSSAINELILFTDNTRSLAKKRDVIYSMYESAYRAGYKGNVSWIEFHPLFMEAVKQYCKEFEKCSHVKSITDNQMEEYCILYTKGYENWKQSNVTINS